MADRAVGELTGLNVVFGDERFTQVFLIGRVIVLHIKNLFARPEKLSRVAMAVETPLHIKRVGLPNQGHLINLAVTRLTTDTLVDVDTMVEINEIGQIVDPVPPDRFILSETGPYRF